MRAGAGRDGRGSAPGRFAGLAGAVGLLVATAAAVGCNAPTPPQAWAPPATPDPRIAEVQGQLARAFVVFSGAALEIDRVGEPVAAPVLVGSRPSPETMTSDAPDVVSVETDGRLLAHREGRASIRSASGGPSLAVTVRIASAGDKRAAAAAEKSGGAGDVLGSLTLRPPKARLRLGEIQTFEALTPRGPVPGSWSTSNDRVVAHLQDHVFQGTEPGQAQVCARAAGRRACAAVEVTP
jgi:hypothetical protein